MPPMDLDPSGEGPGEGEGSPTPKSTSATPKPESQPPADQENGVTSSPTHSSSPAPSNPANPKDAELLEQELASINSVLASISPAAARAAVRQNWRKCLLGSSSDESFFLRGLLGRTSDHVITRVLEDDQQRILEVANEHGKAFLDRAMEVRLESISAKDLVAMLAQARRLGYDEMDLVDADETVVPVDGRPKEVEGTDEEVEEGLQVERPQRAETKAVIPDDEWKKERMRTFRMQQQQQHDANEAKRRQQIEEHARSGSKRKICPTCGATFLQSAGLAYHISHKVCLRQKPPQVSKVWCDNCQKGFTTLGGLTYHKMNNVCKSREMGTPTPPDAQRRGEEQAAAPPATQPPHHIKPSYPTTTQLFNSLPGSTTLPHHHPQPPQPPPPAPRYPNFNNINSPTPVPSLPSQHYQSMPPVVTRPTAVSLTPEQLADMNRELLKEEERFEAQIRALPENLSATERDVEFRRLKAGSSTRKSIVRRKYGVQVRRSKVAPANSVRTPGGGIDIVMKDSDAPPATSGFAAINRIAAFAAVPGKAPDGSMTGADSHAQPSEDHDAKRRRMTTNLPTDMHTPAAYARQNEADRRHTIDPYRRPNIYASHQSPYAHQSPYTNPPPDQGPPPPHRQNGVPPLSRPPIYTTTHSHTMPQGSPHLGQPPAAGFTSVNVDAPRPTAPVAHMGGAELPPSYVDQERRHSHTHPATNGEASGFGVLKAKKVPVEDAQRVWEYQRGWRAYTGPGPAKQAKAAAAEGAVTNGSEGFRQGEVVEILSDSSEGEKMAREKDVVVAAAGESAVAAPRVPKEAMQGPGAGGVPVNIPVSTITTTRRGPAGDSVMVDVNGAAEEEEESSDGDSDSEIPARRPGSKGSEVRGLSERPEGMVGMGMARRGKGGEGRVMGRGVGKENVRE